MGSEVSVGVVTIQRGEPLLFVRTRAGTAFRKTRFTEASHPLRAVGVLHDPRGGWIVPVTTGPALGLFELSESGRYRSVSPSLPGSLAEHDRRSMLRSCMAPERPPRSMCASRGTGQDPPLSHFGLPVCRPNHALRGWGEQPECRAASRLRSLKGAAGSAVGNNPEELARSAHLPADGRPGVSVLTYRSRHERQPRSHGAGRVPVRHQAEALAWLAGSPRTGAGWETGEAP